MFDYKSLPPEVLDKTLHELGIWPDDNDPCEPEYMSPLVRTCLRLRHVPLGEYVASDLRIMIGQNIGLECLVPMALDLLEFDPWTEGDFGAGDLLSYTLGCKEFWLAHPVMAARTNRIIDNAIAIRKRAHRETVESYYPVNLKKIDL